MLARLRGQLSGHVPPAPPEPAPKPAEQPSHLAWRSGNMAAPLARVRTPRRHRIRRAPDQQPHRHMPVRVTDAAVAGLASTVRSETSDKGREVGQMCGWDVCGGPPDAPDNTLGESPSGDSRGSLGHEPPGRGRAWRGYRSRPAPRGPVASAHLQTLGLRLSGPLALAAVQHLRNSRRPVTELVVASPKRQPLVSGDWGQDLPTRTTSSR